jgi:hypothetical protein
MKKRNPSSGQNGQLVHWWLLIHSGPEVPGLYWSQYQVYTRHIPAKNQSWTLMPEPGWYESLKEDPIPVTGWYEILRKKIQ